MSLTIEVCVACGCQHLKVCFTYQTSQNGQRKMYKCGECGNLFSETKNTPMEGIRKPISLVAMALRNRLGGMGFNETARTFEISRDTLRDWERRFVQLKDVLLIYALSHQFIEMIIEGDELYTKVNKNLPADKSKGWTIVLMDRASRFIWLQTCGSRDRKLFKKAIKQLSQLIERSRDLTLITDGERRYGNILFEICTELIKGDGPGRPKKLFAKVLK
jgi:transposase-like protein